MKEVCLASTNRHKIQEIKAILEPLGYRVLSLLDFPNPLTIVESGSTFEENAYIKAMACFEQYKIPCLADDSGLEVESLDQRPGVYSQRYSQEGTDQANLDKLLVEMKGHQNRNARFVCVLCYVDNQSPPTFIRGECQGLIAYHPIYQHGFGYDPIFYLPERQKMFSELSLAEKNLISHRGKALIQLQSYLGGK